MRSLSRVIRAVLLLGVACLARLALAAADPSTHSIAIPAQDLGTALLKFAAATHEQIAFDHDAVEGYQSTSLSGDYTIDDGLRALIGTAPFEIRTTPSGVMTVAGTPAATPDRDARTAGSQSPAPGAAGEPHVTYEVIVSARRRAELAELAPRVSTFVYGIAVPAQGTEQLARWQRPVCPLVSGLPQEEGEFILARISEIARTAGVPLAGEQCRPNLYILVSPEPRELLRGMQRRNRRFTFGADPYPLAVAEFIDTARPVRVWYNTTLLDAWGLRPNDPGPGTVNGSPGAVNSAHEILHSNSGSLASNIDYNVYRAFVIVDWRRLQGVSRGQLADYVAMVGLAQIKPAAQLGDAPTILKLFAGAPQAAPSGMSDWDHAFLKTLYEDDLYAIAQQRALIVRRMVREILP